MAEETERPEKLVAVPSVGQPSLVFVELDIHAPTPGQAVEWVDAVDVIDVHNLLIRVILVEFKNQEYVYNHC